MVDKTIESTPLWLDIKSVIDSGKKPVKYEYRGMLHNVKEDVSIYKITSIDIIRDYAGNISDHIQIEFKMLLGDYMKRLYPYKANLEFSVKRIELKEVSSDREDNSLIYTEKYKAIFLTGENPAPAMTDLESLDTETLNKGSLVDVKLQLLNRSLEPIRIKTVSGIFRQVTQKKIMYNILAGESAKILIDGKSSIDGIDIVDPDNIEVRKHVVIPDGTLISNLPTFLQEKSGGVYNSGIGTYLQKYNNKTIWFIYPLFNYHRFDKDIFKIVFFAVPEYRLSGIDRTYNEEGKTLKILVTSKRKYKDSGETSLMNKGVGFRMADARSFMKKPVAMTEEGPISKRANTNHEVSLRSRNDGLNYAPVVKASSNPFKEYSKLILSDLGQIDLVWENSNHDLIHPGMPCKYVFQGKDKPIELKGVVMFTHTLISLEDSNVYKNITHITLACESYNTDPDVPEFEAVGEF